MQMMNDLSVGTQIESANDYRAAVRISELKPTAFANVFEDPEGTRWYVDDPVPMNPAQRRERFAFLQWKRGKGPKPF